MNEHVQRIYNELAKFLQSDANDEPFSGWLEHYIATYYSEIELEYPEIAREINRLPDATELTIPGDNDPKFREELTRTFQRLQNLIQLN